MTRTPANAHAKVQTDKSRGGSRVARLKALARGEAAEAVAALSLRLKGYRILDRRFKTKVGEVDIIARRGGCVAFVEVKQRATRALCEAAVTDETRMRVRRAAEVWLARHHRFNDDELRFDVIFVIPRRWPEHLIGAL
ncbi:MAG: YraN family protein [Hyphomicrobiaceae bacterium]|nr:YraN family protein [Hyphomicrobiaceae bacterium]